MMTKIECNCGDNDKCSHALWCNVNKKPEHEMVEISMYEVNRLDYACRNMISICDIMQKDVEKRRISLIRKVLGEYMTEIDVRYTQLVKELERLQ